MSRKINVMAKNGTSRLEIFIDDLEFTFSESNILPYLINGLSRGQAIVYILNEWFTANNIAVLSSDETDSILANMQ